MAKRFHAQAKRLGILDGLNPIQDTSIPNVPEASEDTYAYSLAEIKSMLGRLVGARTDNRTHRRI
jgi:hypothetical protein